jgi:hypothetical protein
MTSTERKHLRRAEKIVWTIWNHGRDIDTDGTLRPPLWRRKRADANWQRILAMIDEWMREEP